MVIAVVIGIVAHRVLYRLLARWAERRHSTFAAAVLHRTCRPAAYIFPLVAILAAAPQLDLPNAVASLACRGGRGVLASL